MALGSPRCPRAPLALSSTPTSRRSSWTRCAGCRAPLASRYGRPPVTASSASIPAARRAARRGRSSRRWPRVKRGECSRWHSRSHDPSTSTTARSLVRSRVPRPMRSHGVGSSRASERAQMRRSRRARRSTNNSAGPRDSSLNARTSTSASDSRADDSSPSCPRPATPRTGSSAPLPSSPRSPRRPISCASAAAPGSAYPSRPARESSGRCP